MNDIDKLRALLPHWIEHNQEHALDFGRWAGMAQESGHEAAADLIRQAMQCIQRANSDLEQALDELGGPVSLEQHHHAH